MPSTSANQPFNVYRIFEEDDFSGTLADLLGSYFDIDTPDLGIASGFKSHRLRGDALKSLLGGDDNRGPNDRLGATKYVRYTTSAEITAQGDLVLDQYEETTLVMHQYAVVEFPGAGRTQTKRLVYDPAPRTQPGLRARQYGTATSAFVPVKWVDTDQPEAGYRAYSEYPAGYVFATDEIVRSYGGGSSTEQFIKRKAPGGAAPDLSNVAGDANWEVVSRDDVPPPVITRAEFDALYDSVEGVNGEVILLGERMGEAEADLTQAENDIVDLQNEKVDKADIANNLTTATAGKVLDAQQGKVLGDRTTALEGLALDQNTVNALNNTTFLASAANAFATEVDGFLALASVAGLVAGGQLYHRDHYQLDVDRNIILPTGTGIKIFGLKVPESAPAARTFTILNGGDVDTLSAITMAPGEWRVFQKRTGSNANKSYITLWRGSTAAPSAAAGIDYANPVTLTATAALTANTAYYVTGAGYALTLPDAAANLGKAIFISIASAATGLYPIAGAGTLALYAKESIAFRATADGWKRTGGELLALAASLKTSPSQQDAIPGSSDSQLPFSLVGETNTLLPLAQVAGSRFVVQRDGRATLDATVVLKNCTLNGQYYCQLVSSTRGVLKAAYATTEGGPSAFGVAGLSATKSVSAGEELTVRLYAGQPTNIAGGSDGNACTFSFTELV